MNVSPISFVAPVAIGPYVPRIVQKSGIRRAVFAAVMAAWCHCAPVHAPFEIALPPVAYSWDREALLRDDIAACSETVSSLAWDGNAPWEAAAFLRLDENGHFRCEVWPVERRSRVAHWRGLMPPGTAALIHSHARRDTQPSPQDADEACRLGIPVIVATIDSISMALPCKTEIVEAPVVRHVHTAAHVR